jgi:hypothetical protein
MTHYDFNQVVNPKNLQGFLQRSEDTRRSVISEVRFKKSSGAYIPRKDKKRYREAFGDILLDLYGYSAYLEDYKKGTCL